MSDLIEWLRELGDCPREWALEAADALEAKDAEIERLNCALIISRGKHENAIREIERLQQIERSYIAIHAISGEQQAENERLRAALEEIAKRTCPASCDNIAREALDDE